MRSCERENWKTAFSRERDARPKSLLGYAEKVPDMPDLPARQVQGGQMKMYAYSSNEANVEKYLFDPQSSISLISQSRIIHIAKNQLIDDLISFGHDYFLSPDLIGSSIYYITAG